ncbi:hypothetical protein BH20ACT10_BH20ACT10_24250 [soil metagenome]|jgi:hypothetical protein
MDGNIEAGRGSWGLEVFDIEEELEDSNPTGVRASGMVRYDASAFDDRGE